VAVISRDNDKSLVQDAQLLKLSNSSANSIIELQKITQSTVIIKGVHLLVNRGSLRHQEESLVATALVQNIDGLERHVLETGQVKSRRFPPLGVILKVLEVLCVDVAVQPNGHGALAENTKSLLAVVGSEERLLVIADGVALLGEFSIVVLALVRARTGVELLSTATEEDIRAAVVCPGVVGHAIESLVN
jgi:hypothetical protein